MYTREENERNWNFYKRIRYLVFAIFHFIVWNIQIAIDEDERDEFYQRYHKNDIRD